jgi:hypothetical protein
MVESIQAIFSQRDWIDSNRRDSVMHPINVLFEDIYRNHWGISPRRKRPADHRIDRLRRRVRDLLAEPEGRRG